jgi:hypothetical protein
MKKIVKLSEEKLEKIISTIIEQVQNLDDYAEEDFIEAFLVTFRQWVTEKLGDESKKYPLSYFRQDTIVNTQGLTNIEWFLRLKT